ANRGVWFVSNFGQNLDLSGATPDQPAYLSRLGPGGDVQEERVIEIDGDLLGIASLDGMLYVSHANELLEVNPDDGSVRPIAVEGAGFLNDVTAGNGAVFFSDTATNTIYRYAPGGPVEVFSQDPSLAAPNGLVVTDGQLYVATLGAFPPDPSTPGAIYRIANDGTATRFGDLDGVFDGIETDGDGWVVTDFNGTLWRVDASGSGELLWDATTEGLQSTADIGFDPARRIVLVPDLAGNAAYLYEL
ncbi:MAG: hypothetical protein AAGE52_32710, partial [Myxococcota bacterium]